MRQSIQTKYIGPTDHRGSRVKARTSSGITLTLGWDDALGVDDNHSRAAQALALRLGWAGRWYAGGGQDGKGNVYVQDDGGTDGFMIFPPTVRDLRENAPESRGGIASTLDDEEARTRRLEAEGLTRSDAQAAVGADSRARAQAAVDAVFGYVPDDDPRGVR